MTKLFTQKLAACFTLILGFSVISMAQVESFLVINSPASAAGEIQMVRGLIGNQDDNLTVTGDLQLGNDGVEGDVNNDMVLGTVTDGCEDLITDGTGKIVLLDRGECAFYFKARTGAASGAIAVVVCQNRADAPFAMGAGANGEGTEVTIPVFMASQADCNALKVLINGGATVNGTIENRKPECPVTYDTAVFWGNQPGEGDFSVPFAESGWTTVNILPLDRDDVIWERTEDANTIFDRFFGSGVLIESPSGCNGTASFSAVKHAIGDNPNPTQPYTRYEAELISPVIDCSGKDNIALEFYQLYNDLNLESFSLSTSTDGGTTWSAPIPISTENATNTPPVLTERRLIPLPQFTNVAEARFKFTAAQDFYYTTIDDVTLRSEVIKDMRANTNWYATAPNYLTPTTLVDEIGFMIDIENVGNQNLDNVNVLVEVTDPNLDVVHTQTLGYGTVNAGVLAENAPFPQTFTPAQVDGRYRIKYTVTADGEDRLTNNVAESEFFVGGDVYSKIPLEDPADPYIQGWSRTGTSFFSWGNYYKFPSDRWSNGNFYVIDKVRSGFSTSNTAPAGFLIAHAYRWVDANADGVCSSDERVLLAEGRTVVEAEASDIEIDMFDLEDPDEKYTYMLGDDEGILIMIHANNIDEQDRWFFSAINTEGFPGFNVPASSFVLDSLGKPSASGFYGVGSSNDDIEDRDFTREPGPLVWYTPLVLSEVSSTGDLNEDIKFTSYPNPTTDKLTVEVNLEDVAKDLTVFVNDMTGKTAMVQKYSNVAQKSIELNVTSLPTGTYTLRVQTEEGFNITKFNVVR